MIEMVMRGRAGEFRLEVDCRMEAPLTVVFGPSGAGKSTMLRMIAGLARPGSGFLSANGRTLTDVAAKIHLPPGRRGVGMAGQSAALFPQMTVEGNVAFGLRELSSAARRERVAEALNVVGAAALSGRRVATRSGGEAQRVALVRALAPRPEVLLLDEPLSALDTAARDGVMAATLEWVGEHGMQAILVTHDAAEALRAQAEVVRLKDGRVTAQGRAAEVLADERHRLLERLKMS